LGSIHCQTAGEEVGSRYTDNEVASRLQRACRRAGVRKVTYHVPRYTFCSHLAMRGAPAWAIKELAGHASITTTRRYMHLLPAAVRDAIDLLDRPWPSGGPRADNGQESKWGRRGSNSRGLAALGF